MLAEVNNNADITILQESFCLFVFGTPECGKHERPTFTHAHVHIEKFL
jgi:hypothetical protein